MTNKAEDTKRILVALDLTHQSGREHLAGFYSFADKKSNWEIRLVPSTEPSYLPMVERFLECLHMQSWLLTKLIPATGPKPRNKPYSKMLTETKKN